MEQKMAQGAGLSLRQKQFLAVVLQTEEILKQLVRHNYGRTTGSETFSQSDGNYRLSEDACPF